MKQKSFVLCFIICILCSGCQSEEQNSTGYQVYFPVQNGSFGAPALISETYTISEDEEVIPKLLELLLNRSESEGLSSLIPTGISVRDWKLEDGVLSVDFSSAYGLLSGIDLTLVDYSVTITLSQLPEVESVVTTVEGDRITYRDHQNLQEKDVFLSIYRSEAVTRQVTLFFPNKELKNLGQEERSILLPEDESLMVAVLNALAEGPTRSDLTAVLSKTEILSSEVRDGMCYLNLAATFQELAPEEESADQLIIYALVNTLCELDNISAVRFLSEGEAMERYATVDLSDPLTSQSRLTEQISDAA